MGKYVAQACMSLLPALLWTSCMPKQQNRIVATVLNKSLYYEDIKHIFPENATAEDSITRAKLYIDKWIATQLLLHKAELNLSKEQLDISKEMETYRTSLLIYKYEDRMLHEKLDTAVSDREIQDYYENNSANFILDETAVRALYICLPANAPNLHNVRRWYVSDKQKDVEELSEYCALNALVFENFNDDWALWRDVAERIPQAEEATRRMQYAGRMEFQDERMVYFLHVREKKLKGEVAPLTFVREKIKYIIINKRKVEFITQLEKSIYNDALSRKQFEIY
ncbi:MAG: hypothetical protein LBR08_07480 [Bacteroidales bacterium]|jgi:hypothetical protein|nr:hypothetical protein [Bacteroidales bacterium]